MDPACEPFALGDWCVDASTNRLTRGDETRPLRHKAMAVLVLLARQPGQTVSRETLIDTIWEGNRFVAPKAINTAIWTIRQALGDDPEAPRYLETIAKKGYRLIAPVQAIAPPVMAAAAAPTPPAPPVERRSVRPRAAWLGAATLGAALLVGTLLAREPAPPPALATPVPLTQDQGMEYLGQVSPDGRWLAYAWWPGHGDGRLRFRAADDLAAPSHTLAGDPGDVQSLSWSPDGRALAFVAVTADGRCRLWRARWPEAQLRVLADCRALATPSVAWSPDGRWIAFSAEADGAGGLFLVHPDGQGLRRLTTAPPAAPADHQPTWSPDGQRLVFARQDPADGSRDLFETTLAGAVSRLSTLRLHSLHGLTFEADGRDLVLSTTHQDSRVLWRWHRDSGATVPLGLEGSAPVRHADGRLVYALLRSHVSIARLAVTGGAPERLVTSVASDRAPDVEPGRGRLAFVSRRSGHAELWRAEADGSQPVMLTRLQAPLAAPAWSPQGGQLVFLGACGPGGRPGVCRVGADGGTVHPVVADAARYGRPVWHPEVAEVWVTSDRGGRWQAWRIGLDGRAAALATELPPAVLQWRADGRAWAYQPRFQGVLHWPSADGGAERRTTLVGPGETLVDWRLDGATVLALTRGSHEGLWRVDVASGARQRLSQHPLGTFPERARLAVALDGSVRVEVANTAVADLMQLR